MASVDKSNTFGHPQCRHADSQSAVGRGRVSLRSAGKTYRTDQRRHDRLCAPKTVSPADVCARLRNCPATETRRGAAFRLVQRIGGGGRWYRNLQFFRSLLRCLYVHHVGAPCPHRGITRGLPTSPVRFRLGGLEIHQLWQQTGAGVALSLIHI